MAMGIAGLLICAKTLKIDKIKGKRANHLVIFCLSVRMGKLVEK